ncbi:MAG: tRNA pseudouridine(38-40) synthase TruA [Bauldia sp.]|nr:tRNA pseudouridine(38-40) synthase TruA [Bauldia sp.]
MLRYRITVEYDGTPFVGWQRQANGLSVQGALEAAILKLTGAEASVRGAGRTDAGVHAYGQVAHFDLPRAVPTDTIRDGLNAHLRPHPIAVLDAAPAAADFDARFRAVARHYLYRVLDRRAPAVLDRMRVWHVTRPLDLAAMGEGARALIGRHDFSTFRAAECQAKSPVKTLDRLDVERVGDEVWFSASAPSFLHSQVRSMVGTLVKVGTGAWPASAVGNALAARDRTRCGPLAPPHGLYLMRVDYPPAAPAAPSPHRRRPAPAPTSGRGP